MTLPRANSPRRRQSFVERKDEARRRGAGVEQGFSERRRQWDRARPDRVVRVEGGFPDHGRAVEVHFVADFRPDGLQGAMVGVVLAHKVSQVRFQIGRAVRHTKAGPRKVARAEEDQLPVVIVQGQHFRVQETHFVVLLGGQLVDERLTTVSRGVNQVSGHLDADPAIRQVFRGNVETANALPPLGPDEGGEALKEPHVKEFDITGKRPSPVGQPTEGKEKRRVKLIGGEK